MKTGAIGIIGLTLIFVALFTLASIQNDFPHDAVIIASGEYTQQYDEFGDIISQSINGEDFPLYTNFYKMPSAGLNGKGAIAMQNKLTVGSNYTIYLKSRWYCKSYFISVNE